MAEVYLGLGSNLGDKAQNIRTALSLLEPDCAILRVSRLYKTAPVGYLDQDWFLNAAALVTTGLSPTELLLKIREVEAALKRQRTIPNGPRTIDVDVLFYDDRVIQGGDLAVPHPRLQERAFVLAPLAEIAPNLRHPQFGKTIAELLAELPDGQPAVEVFS